jgi:hypothetical protein
MPDRADLLREDFGAGRARFRSVSEPREIKKTSRECGSFFKQPSRRRLVAPMPPTPMTPVAAVADLQRRTAQLRGDLLKHRIVVDHCGRDGGRADQSNADRHQCSNQESSHHLRFSSHAAPAAYPVSALDTKARISAWVGQICFHSVAGEPARSRPSTAKRDRLSPWRKNRASYARLR